MLIRKTNAVWLLSTCWVACCLCAAPASRLFGQEPSAKTKPTQETKVPPDEFVPLLHSYDEAVEKSEKSDRPILVVLGAEWCGPCKQLEKELETPSAKPIFQKWIVVKVDIDEEVGLAKEWQVNAVPAFRVLGLDQDVVASNEGFGGLKKLQSWLEENFELANPQTQKFLRDDQPVDSKIVHELVAMLRDRRAATRKRVSERLATNKGFSARPLVEILEAGNLSQKIAAIEILEKWSAPVAGMDPWEPDTINAQGLTALEEWLKSDSR